MDSKMIPILQDGDLILRPWIIDYAEDYYRINSNSHVTDASGVKRICDIKAAKAKIKAIAKKKGMEWSIAAKEGHDYKIVGGISLAEVISIHEYSDVKEIGYGLDESYWGRGIVPHAVSIVENYCFEKLGSQALVIRFMDYNNASKRVAEKCGYTYHSKKKIGNAYKVNYIKIK